MEIQITNQKTDVGCLGRGEENSGACARDGAETARDRSPVNEEGRIAVVKTKAKPLRDGAGKFIKAPSKGPKSDECVRREDRVSTDVVLTSDVELLSDVENAERINSRRKRSSSFFAPEFLDSDTENEGIVAAKARKGKGKSIKAGASKQDFIKPASVLLEDVLGNRKYRKGPAATAASLTDTETGLGDVTESDLSRLNAQELKLQAGDKLNCILEVAKKSGNLKGEFVNRLKNSASTLREMVEVLANRSEAEETRRLRAENSRLRLEVEAIKAEVIALRRGFTEAKTQAAAATSAAAAAASEMPAPLTTTLGAVELVEELKRSLTMTLGQMMDARLAGIEDRLLPAPTVRPPLRADAKRAAEASASAIPQKPVPEPARNPAQKAGKRTGQTSKTANTTPSMAPAGDSSTGTQSEATPSTAPQAEAWTTVVRKGKKGKNKGEGKSPSAAPATAAGARSSKSKPAAAKAVLRPPKSAAIVVTLKPEAAKKGITYHDLITEAQERINIQELGIDQLRFRQTATGSRLFEVPGSQNGEKADKLAEKLREVLSEVATIARPVKSVDLRIMDLNDAATKEKVAAAIAEAGSCDVGLIKTGEIRRDPSGPGSILVTCPVSAAKTVLAKNKFLIGWSKVRVVALEVLPMRCFKCMGLGHTRPQCPESSTDRGDLCFRCGGTGHQAASCTKTDPRCAICAELGKPSGHVMGGRKCAPPKVKGKATRTQAVPNEEVVMSD